MNQYSRRISETAKILCPMMFAGKIFTTKIDSHGRAWLRPVWGASPRRPLAVDGWGVVARVRVGFGGVESRQPCPLPCFSLVGLDILSGMCWTRSLNSPGPFTPVLWL